jgi:hypothetical protein
MAGKRFGRKNRSSSMNRPARPSSITIRARRAENEPARAELAAFKKNFDWMLAPARNLRRNPWAFLHEPDTYMDRVRVKMQEFFERRVREVGQEQFVRELVGVGLPRRVLLEGFARAADHMREEESEIANLPRG